MWQRYVWDHRRLQFHPWFKYLDSYHIGMMVATLEVGASSRFHPIPLISTPASSLACSYVESSPACRRNHRLAQNPLLRRSRIRRRRRHPIFCHQLQSHGPRSNFQRTWSWPSLVSTSELRIWSINEFCPNRTLVTIYWSEDSPAEHLSLLDALRVQVEYDSVY